MGRKDNIKDKGFPQPSSWISENKPLKMRRERKKSVKGWPLVKSRTLS